MILLLAFILVTVSTVLYYIIQSKSKFWQSLRPIPQPPGWPIFGNLFELMQPPDLMFLGDRERTKKYHPIHKTSVFNEVAVILTHPEDIELIVTNPKHNTKSPIYDFLHGWLGTGLLTSSGAKWQTRRKILTPAFHFNILQEFIGIFNEETERFVEDLEVKCRQSPILDVIPLITQLTLNAINETSMGTTLDTPKASQDEYRSNIYRVGELLTKRAPRPWLWNPLVYSLTENGRTEAHLVKTLHAFSHTVIEKRKAAFDASYATRKRLAMLDLLLRYQAEGASIDDEGIREEVDTFMFEGHDTTSMALCYILMAIANNQPIQERISEEMADVFAGEATATPSYGSLAKLKYMERCIKEALRLYPSVPFIARITGEEVKTKTGYTIPEQCPIHIHIFDLHRTEELFPEAEKFDPDRFLPENSSKRHPFAYLPFSAGPRNCIGQKFAFLEMKAVLCGVLSRFRLEPVDRPEDIVFISDLVLRSKGPIRVKFVPRV